MKSLNSLKYWDWILAWRLLKNSQQGRFFSVSLVVSILGMSFGVMALLLSLGITEGFSRDYEKAVLGAQPHIIVQSEDEIEDPSAVQSMLLNISQKEKMHIRAMEPVVYREGMLIGGKSLKGFVVKGISRDYFKNSGIKIVQYSKEKNEKHLPEIYLGKSLAEDAGISSGVVKLLFPKNTDKKHKIDISSQDLKSFFLAGIFETGVYELDASFGWLDVNVAQDFFHLNHQISGFEIWLDQAVQADALTQKIRDELSFPYEVLSWKDVNENIFKAMETEKWMFGLLMCVLIIVASLNVLGTLMMLLLKKRRQIAILRTLGYSWKRLKKIFLFDGLLMGSVGTLLGIFFGLGGEFILKRWEPIRLDAEIYFLKTVPVAFSWEHIAWVVLASWMICGLGCLLSLRKISQISTLDILEKS